MRYFNAKKAFLTYQHCEVIVNFDKLNLRAFLFLLPNIETVTVGQEIYPTEPGFHCHVLLTFKEKTKFNFVRFDYLGITPYNENFRSSSKAEILRVYEYCIKDGCFTSTYTPPEPGNISNWASIAAAETREEALSLLLKHYPRDAVLQRRNFDYWAERNYEVLREPYVGGDFEFDVPPVVQEWVESEFSGKFFFIFVTYRPYPPKRSSNNPLRFS